MCHDTTNQLKIKIVTNVNVRLRREPHVHPLTCAVHSKTASAGIIPPGCQLCDCVSNSILFFWLKEKEEESCLSAALVVVSVCEVQSRAEAERKPKMSAVCLCLAGGSLVTVANVVKNA